MRFAFLLAVRYFRAPRPNFLARLTALAAVAGIAFGTAAMIFALALSNGFREAMREKILANTAHIAVFRADGNEIENWENLAAQIRQIPNVEIISAQSFDNALLIGKTNSAFAVLRGSQEKSQILIEEKETNEKIKIEIGKILAEKTGLKAGDAAEIVSGSGEINENFAPTSTIVEVGGIFETGLYEYDSTWIRLSLKDAAKLTGKSISTTSTIAVKTKDIYQTNEIATKIAEKISREFKILDWREANRPLFAALSLERQIAFLIVGLIILIAALNITTTLALSVGERRFDIAVLRACGASGRTIVSVFLLEGVFLAAFGLCAGILIGVLICFLGNQFDLIRLPADVYEIGSVSLRINSAEILLIALAVLILSLAASWIPARAAAEMRPAENLKN